MQELIERRQARLGSVPELEADLPAWQEDWASFTSFYGLDFDGDLTMMDAP